MDKQQWHSWKRRQFGVVYTRDGRAVAERVPPDVLALVTAAPALLTACEAQDAVDLHRGACPVCNSGKWCKELAELGHQAAKLRRAALAAARGEVPPDA